MKHREDISVPKVRKSIIAKSFGKILVLKNEIPNKVAQKET